jgi:hypothetical protein
MSADEVLRTATDVATYVGAVSAGVSANALTDGARTLVYRVLKRLGWREGDKPLAVDAELIAQVAELLRSDSAMRSDAAQVFDVDVRVTKSIIVTGHHVEGITQTNS